MKAGTNGWAVGRGAITVYALNENPRPVGFASWPEQEPPKAKKKKRKR